MHVDWLMLVAVEEKSIAFLLEDGWHFIYFTESISGSRVYNSATSPITRGFGECAAAL
jgi:hypothetical protein